MDKTDQGSNGMFLTTTRGNNNLPRYFPAVFELATKINRGRIDFFVPDGRKFRAEGTEAGPVCEMHIHDADTFARLMREGELGFCDAYIDGWWSSPDLQAFCDFLRSDNDALYDGFPGMTFVRAFERMRHWLKSNTRVQAKKNISHHYDLGNEFYKLWLDDTMTYSSGIFKSGQESMEVAQIAKYASMVEQMGVQAGDHILEIGCGWGGFAEYAAKECGLKVTGLTISEEQLRFARDRIERAGLSDLVDFKLQDYRDEVGQFDGLASIEMFEAVGEKYWPIYFETVHNRLKPGKQATLQIITIDESRFDTYRKGVDFIQKYIFPGGMLPSPTALKNEINKAGLNFVKSVEFGESYSLTLRRWHDTFNGAWDDVKELGFDDKFRRMWNMYLASCAAAFRSGNCDVTQITISRPN